MTDQKSINYYHRWAHIDEMHILINRPVCDSIKQTHLTFETVKAMRALFILDQIALSIFKSFMSDAHPPQVDDFTRLDWMCALLKIINDWHAMMRRFIMTLQFDCQLHSNYGDFDFIKPEYFTSHTSGMEALTQLQSRWYQQHADYLGLSATEWSQILSHEVKTITDKLIPDDSENEKINQKYSYIEPFFRGIHQILESVMIVATVMVNRVIMQLGSIKVNLQGLIENTQSEVLFKVRSQLSDIRAWWEIAARHIMLLSKMDTGSYAEYRQSLLGTSGGDSRQLRSMKSVMMSLHLNLPKSLQVDDRFMQSFYKHPRDILLNQVLTSIREAQAASSDFWMRHFTLTANTIGITRGSHGLPVEKLLSFAVAPLMKSDSLLKPIAEVGNYYAESPEAVLVEVNQRRVVIGKSIYPHIKENAKYISDFNRDVNTQESILDHFELGLVEQNDYSVSPYHKWFDVDVNTQKIRFEMHSFGSPLGLFYDSLARTSKRMMASQNDYWQVYFRERWQQFKAVLFSALNIDGLSSYTTSMDVNASALLERLLSALDVESGKDIVITSEHEFIASKRILAAWADRQNIAIDSVSLNPECSDLSVSFINAIKRSGNRLKCLLFSQVFSNTQVSLSQGEITAILDAVPSSVPVIIDAVQGLFNLPCDWATILSHRNNVYILGSVIKHARSTSGLGFMIYPSDKGVLNYPRLSGWCAYLSGIADGVTTSDTGRLLYDEPYQWCGGTPGNIFSLELFINTWDAILRSGETITSIHSYTQSLIRSFSEKLPHDLFHIIDAYRRQLYPNAASNAITIKSHAVQSQFVLDLARQQNITFDSRQQLLRLGFGIQHGMDEIHRLLQVFNISEHTH